MCLYDSQLRSYPLGYVPGVETLRNDKYPILQPRPWLNPDNLIEGLTGETEKRWIKHSQIRGEFPCRKIVFRLSSHDQGWGGDRSHKGTYRGSFTWFDVGKERIHTFENGTFSQCPVYHTTKYETRKGSSKRIRDRRPPLRE